MTRGEALPLTQPLPAATRTAEVAVAAIAPHPPHIDTMMGTILLPHPTAATVARLLEAVLLHHPQTEAMDIPLPLADITRTKRVNACKHLHVSSKPFKFQITSNQYYYV